MRSVLALFIPLALGACAAAPDIADWPPRAPDVPDKIVQKYVDVYGAEPAAPMYGPDDVDALILLTRRMLRNDTPDGDIERLRNELDDIRARDMHDNGEARETYSRNEINAIKRRAERRFESKHDQRMELKRYGL